MKALNSQDFFIGHYFDGGDWDDSKISGIKRFIGRFDRWTSAAIEEGEKIDLKPFIEQIDSYVESFKFNKVVSSWMEFYNKNKDKVIDKETAAELVRIFRNFAPGFKK